VIEVETNVSIRLCPLDDGCQGQSGTPINYTTPTSRVTRKLLIAIEQSDLDILSGPDPEVNLFMSPVTNTFRLIGVFIDTQTFSVPTSSC
jgi:hypothetical protein